MDKSLTSTADFEAILQSWAALAREWQSTTEDNAWGRIINPRLIKVSGRDTMFSAPRLRVSE